MHFCLAVNKAASQLGSYTQVFRLTTPQDSNELSAAEVQNFRTTLMLMPNLRELHLDIPCRSFADSFRDLEPSFKLQILCVSSPHSASFNSFIDNQPSITELRIPCESLARGSLVDSSFSVQSDALPQLNNITAPLFILDRVIPGRPVTTVMFDMRRWGVVVGLRGIILEIFWRRIYCTSTVSVTTTGFYHRQQEADPWPLLIPALRNLKVHSHLRRIRVIESFTSKDTCVHQHETLTRRVEQLSTLEDFKQLEAIEVGIVARALDRGLPKGQVLSWLGEMNTIAAWKMHVPSLNRVTMYGIELE